MDLLKEGLVEMDDFEVLFGYIFPVKKLFNFLLIMNDQNVSAFLTNHHVLGAGSSEEPSEGFENHDEREDMHPPIGHHNKGVLAASVIDPEQFKQAKAIAKSIIENLNNSDNYTYTTAEVESAGGQGKLALNRSLEDF